MNKKKKVSVIKDMFMDFDKLFKKATNKKEVYIKSDDKYYKIEKVVKF